MKISAKKRILAGLIIFAVGVVVLSVVGISRVSLQSLTSVMGVIVSTSFFSALAGIIVGLLLSSGLRARKQEKQEKKAEGKEQHLENEKPGGTEKIE